VLVPEVIAVTGDDDAPAVEAWSPPGFDPGLGRSVLDGYRVIERSWVGHLVDVYG
jgi:hypothetical protein